MAAARETSDYDRHGAEHHGRIGALDSKQERPPQSVPARVRRSEPCRHADDRQPADVTQASCCGCERRRRQARAGRRFRACAGRRNTRARRTIRRRRAASTSAANPIDNLRASRQIRRGALAHLRLHRAQILDRQIADRARADDARDWRRSCCWYQATNERSS